MELFVFSKKEDKKLEEIGGEFVNAIVSWEEDDWYYSKFRESFEILSTTRKSKNGFKFNEGRVRLYQPEKGKIILFNKYDNDAKECIDKKEFFSDPETWIEMVDSEKGKDKFRKEKEYLEKRAEEAEKRSQELKDLANRLNEALKRKGGFEFYSDVHGGGKRTIEYVTAVGSAYIEATVWNGSYYCGHKSYYTALLSQLNAKEFRTSDEVIAAILE